jgi:hypothetical protein
VIDQPSFAKLLGEYSESLLHPIPPWLKELNGFQSGLRMYAEWDDVAAVAEISDSYVSFHWSTTA